MKRVAAAVLAAGVVGTTAEPGNPVNKVVTLLNDLRDKLEKDGETDDKDYKKDRCWCKDVQASKKELIETQSKEIVRLESEIEEGSAKDKELEVVIKDTVKSEDENKATSKDGEKTRTEEATVRKNDKQSNTKVVTDLSAAAKKLKGGGGGNGAADSIVAMLDDQIENTKKTEEKASAVEAKAVDDFNSWLGDMKSELGVLVKTEETSRTEEAEVEQEVAADIEMKDDTVRTRAADEAFLAEATQSCADREAEYNERTKLRAQETEGVNKALEILNAKRALFDASFKDAPSFLQIKGKDSSVNSKSKAAHELLQSKAAQAHSVRLSAVALRVKKALSSGQFDDVIKSIDDMLSTLKAESESDVKKKDHCTKEYSTVAKKVSELNFLIQKSTATVAKATARIEEATADTETATTDLAATNKELAELKEQREAENKFFLEEKDKDEQAIAVLKETLTALNEYYAANAPKAALFEYDPKDLSEKRKKLKNSEHKFTLSDKASQAGAAHSIMALMERLIENLQKEIADGQKAEAKSLEAYQKTTGTLSASAKNLQEKISNLGNIKAATNEKKSDEETSLEGSNKDLQGQQDYKDGIKEECDWILAKFDERNEKRSSEKDGLVRAKELLSGASFVQESAASEQHSSLWDYMRS